MMDWPDAAVMIAMFFSLAMIGADRHGDPTSPASEPAPPSPNTDDPKGD